MGLQTSKVKNVGQSKNGKYQAGCFDKNVVK